MITTEYDRLREAVEFGLRMGLPAQATNAVIAISQRQFCEAARLLAGDPHVGADHIADAGKKVAAKAKGNGAKPKRYQEPSTKLCAQCGEHRGVTAFPSGTDVCRRCVKTRGGKLLDPGIKIVRCKSCGRGAPESQINPDGLCGRCTGKES